METPADIDAKRDVRVPPVIAQAPIQPVRSGRSPAIAVRIWSMFFLSIFGSILVFGMLMHPSEKGYGTHSESLHLPACGVLAATGIPCPTCGCTTAVTHLAHGNLWMAFKTQPFGAVFGLVAIYFVVMSILGLIKGKWLWPDPYIVAFRWKAFAIWGTSILILGWMYKIAAMKNGW